MLFWFVNRKTGERKQFNIPQEPVPTELYGPSKRRERLAHVQWNLKMLRLYRKQLAKRGWIDKE